MSDPVIPSNNQVCLECDKHQLLIVGSYQRKDGTLVVKIEIEKKRFFKKMLSLFLT